MCTEKGASAYVERKCGRCFEGESHGGDPTELKKEPCHSCGGTRKVRAFLYAKPKGFRGEWPPKRTKGEEAS
jgi:hypothetical protein